MFKLILMAAMVIPATRDGEYLVVEVPQNWEHVEIETSPSAEFTRKGNVYRGETPATTGTVYAAICDDDTCTPVEAQFAVRSGTGLLGPLRWLGVPILVVFIFLLVRKITVW